MYDASKDVSAYHDDKVTLPQSDQGGMRERRNANRDRLKKGLDTAKKPAPNEFKSQGSYAMKTMTQHPENDYDIDDGVYFLREELVGSRGAEMTALQARQMVRDALDDRSFNPPPETRTNCVRVLYDAGYHVDVPVYRRVVAKNLFEQEVVTYELASSEWKRSDARDVTKWFENENTKQSPDESNGRQLRRITRYIKKFARSRSSWQSQILSGFGITKLVTECYKSNLTREETSLYDTMKAIRDRLAVSLVVQHPVTPNDTITSGTEDPKARFLKDRLSDAIGWLKPLFASDCTRKTAMKCWDDVFFTTYFSDRIEKEGETKTAKAASEQPAILTSGLLKEIGTVPSVRNAVQKDGDRRYA